MACLAALSPVPLDAASSGRFEDTAQVVSVQVPVEVVGRDGGPVRGLTAADFEVFDEGRKQEIKSFEVVDLGQTAPAAGAAGAAAKEEEPVTASGRRHFLLLFDLSFARPAAVLKAREAARDFVLSSLHPSDLVAVATYSLQAGPRLIITFTPDRAQLARAIQSLGLDNSFDAFKADPLHFVIAPPDLVDRMMGTGGMPSLPESRGRLEPVMEEEMGNQRLQVDRADRTFGRTQIASFLRSMGDLAKTLDSVKGRKHVVLFSEGFDSRLLLGYDTLSHDASLDNVNIEHGDLDRVDNDNRYGNTELQGRLVRTLREFQRADCVIEAVDIGGLRAGGDATGEPRPVGDDALFAMADGTGGELFKDANDLKDQLARVLERSTVTYLLTFERSDLKPDGSFRRLKVRAKLPAGARVSYRAGYYAPRPFKTLDPLEKNLLAADGIAGAAARRDLDVNLLVSSFRAGEKLAYVPVIIEVGGERLLAGHKGDKLEVEFYTYVSDAQGEMKDFNTQRIALNVKNGRQAVLGGGVKYYGHLELAPGNYRVRVLVRDAETGHTGVQTAALQVPAYGADEPVLLPPFFMDPHGGWVMVRERTAESAQDSVIYPFTVKGEPYVPAALPTLAADKQARLCLVAYNLGRGSLQVKGHVTTADGQRLPGGRLAVVERTNTGVNGLDQLLATFQPTGLNAGNYVLKVAVTDPKTGREGVNSVPFQVVQ